jgi:hypothetical protein
MNSAKRHSHEVIDTESKYKSGASIDFQAWDVISFKSCCAGACSACAAADARRGVGSADVWRGGKAGSMDIVRRVRGLPSLHGNAADADRAGAWRGRMQCPYLNLIGACDEHKLSAGRGAARAVQAGSQLQASGRET